MRGQKSYHQFHDRHQQQSSITFGSLPCDFPSGRKGLSSGSSFEGFSVTSESKSGGFNESGNRFQNTVDSIRIKQLETPENSNTIRGKTGLYKSSPSETSRSPPGFSSKQRGGMNRDTMSRNQREEHNVHKNKGNASELNLVDEKWRRMSNRQSELGLVDQLDHPGPPSGSKLHSFPASDIEESMSDLHSGVTELVNEPKLLKKGNTSGARDEFDDFGEDLLRSLVVEDESVEKNGRKQHRSSRDKDIRSDSRGQRILNQRMRNYKKLFQCRGEINKLNAPFLAIYESLIPAEEEKAKQKQLLSFLENLVRKEWPDGRLYVYGSCANSFGVSKSDIDVCLTLVHKDLKKSEVLLKLADILQSDNLQNVQALTRARVPIVKLMDPATGMSCDICINNVLAVVNTKLLRDYAQLDVRLRQLAFIVKHWAKSRGVNETYQGTLSSYAYVLMCIHFLQQRKPAILPCLQGMEATYAVTVEDVECAFFDQVEKLRDFGSSNHESIAQLVWAFFNYWAYCHDYTNSVISVRTGRILSKQEKDWTRRVGNDRHLICIEDPFETSHDLGRVVDKYSIKVLREEFERAAEIMQYDPNPSEALFQPYVPS